MTVLTIVFGVQLKLDRTNDTRLSDVRLTVGQRGKWADCVHYIYKHDVTYKRFGRFGTILYGYNNKGNYIGPQRNNVKLVKMDCFSKTTN